MNRLQMLEYKGKEDIPKQSEVEREGERKTKKFWIAKEKHGCLNYLSASVLYNILTTSHMCPLKFKKVKNKLN